MYICTTKTIVSQEIICFGILCRLRLLTVRLTLCSGLLGRQYTFNWDTLALILDNSELTNIFCRQTSRKGHIFKILIRTIKTMVKKRYLIAHFVIILFFVNFMIIILTTSKQLTFKSNSDYFIIPLIYSGYS